MPLIIPPLIQTPFADSGDKTTVPQTDPSGFVSFLTGYTPDYELNLASGDPQAKAVERGIQNYLFNTGTLATKAWQTAARPPWYNTMPGGYAKWAEVVYDTGDGNPKPFRSLVSGNVAAPGSSPNWEYIQGSGEMIKNIPMPSGGAGGPGTYLITVATDFNTITGNGSWQFQSDAIVTGSPNSPQNGGNQAQAGMLEVSSWANGANAYVTQFYRDKAGLGWMRGAVNGIWTGWKIWAAANQFVVGEIRMWNGTATQAAITAAWGPGWRLCDGTNGTANLKDRFIIGAGGTIGATGTTGGASAVALAIANMPAHNHVINIGDPGHAHSVYDPGHNHGVSDPGHSHGVADPGHNHSFNGGAIAVAGSAGGFFMTSGGATGTSTNGTGISIYGNGTGIGIAASGTGIGIYANGTGITASSNNTGSGTAFSIMPPYYALCFVQYTGA
jgi:hypothetical protein